MARHPHPHHPLRALLAQAQSAQPLWLPAELSYRPGRASWLLWLVLGWIPWLVVALRLATLGWLALPGWLLCTLWLWRWQRRRDAASVPALPMQFDGWEIDPTTRALQRLGAAPDDDGAPRELLLEPAQDWSLGTIGSVPRQDGRLEPYVWAIELRHRRRGPVAQLCLVHSWSAQRELMRDIDALVDLLVQRLGVRRSGARLVAAPR